MSSGTRQSTRDPLYQTTLNENLKRKICKITRLSYGEYGDPLDLKIF